MRSWLLWIVLCRFWSDWRRCLRMVQPDTVLRWHRRANGHGPYTGVLPYQSLELFPLSGVFLTLHGGSGTDDEDFRSAIAAGINIIHINTELRVAWQRSLEDSLTRQPNDVVPYKILPPVLDSVKQVVDSRLKLFGAQRTPE